MQQVKNWRSNQWYTVAYPAKAIGMGYVPAAMAVEGTSIYISIRDKKLQAEVVKMLFLKSKS